jgi:putative membrane protein
MRILLYVGCFIIFVVALVFSVLNFHAVEIHLYVTTISMPLALALTIELFAGILIGLLASFFYILKLKTRFAELNKKLGASDTPPVES